MLPLLLTLLLTQPVTKPKEGIDYDNGADTYNGIGKFISLAKSEGVTIFALSHIDWEKLPPKKSALLFISPVNPVPPKQLSSYLHLGGRALVAEDFRDGSKLFTTLGLPLQEEETRFPLAMPIVDYEDPLLAEIEAIQTNHPASFTIAKAPILAFPLSKRALFADLEVGEGTLWLLSDPSLFINDMVHRKDNERLLTYIIRSLTKGGRTLYILRQFDHSNWPGGGRLVTTRQRSA